MTDLDRLTGAELQTLREMCGWDRTDLANRMEVKPETVRFWERGKTSVPEEAITLLVRSSTSVKIIAHRLVSANPPILYRIPGHDLHNAAVTIAAALLPESRIVNAEGAEADLEALVGQQLIQPPRTPASLRTASLD